MTALHEWTTLLGERATKHTGPYTQNVTEFQARSIPAMLQPVSTDEVRQIVAIAAKHHAPLYPISTGKNWGLGSRLPIKDGCAIVDLSFMDKVLEINEDLLYAVIEPGVTQRQLADALKGSPCMLNITGSGQHTSVLGNALERGSGVLGQRTYEVRGLEAVLGNGDLIRTGHWAFGQAEDSVWHHHPEGCGPDITGLFFQSGFGIVTKAVIGLYPKQNIELALVQSTDSELAEHIDSLRQLRQIHVLRDRIEVNREDDPRLTGLGRTPKSGAWLTWLALWGDSSLNAPVKDRVSAMFQNVTFYSAADDNLPEPAIVRLRKLSGEPGDEYVHALARRPIDSGSPFAFDSDTSAAGFVCVLPTIPFTGQHVRKALSVMERVDAALGIQSHLTFNSVTASGLEGFFRVLFDRTDKKQVAGAHAWAKQAQKELAAAGFQPARTSVDNMYYDSGHADMISILKRAIDPASIISPGRYIPD